MGSSWRTRRSSSVGWIASESRLAGGARARAPDAGRAGGGGGAAHRRRSTTGASWPDRIRWASGRPPDLVRALAAAGDWIAATRAAREYAARVREELPGVTPTDLEALVERLQRARRPPGSARRRTDERLPRLYASSASSAGARSRPCTWRATGKLDRAGRAQAASARARHRPPTRDDSAGRSRSWRSCTIRTSSSSTTPESWGRTRR